MDAHSFLNSKITVERGLHRIQQLSLPMLYQKCIFVKYRRRFSVGNFLQIMQTFFEYYHTVRLRNDLQTPDCEKTVTIQKDRHGFLFFS